MNGAHRTMLVSQAGYITREFLTGPDDRVAIIVGQSVSFGLLKPRGLPDLVYASICMVPKKSRIVRGRLKVLISRSRKLDLGEAVAYDFQ